LDQGQKPGCTSGAPDQGNDVVNHHASYVEHWLKILKGDSKAILTAASLRFKGNRIIFARLVKRWRED
jgi:antirestriction protein ArdC